MRVPLLAAAVALALAVPVALAAPAGHPVPAKGVLVPGTSLAGVRLGDTEASVDQRFGPTRRRCSSCAGVVWTYPRADGTPALAVAFRIGRVTAVSTLGGQIGWRTPEGLIVGQGIDRVKEVYGDLVWKLCVGYSALTMRRGSAVTTIYTTGDVVYGFGLSRPSEPVCR
jgi:hypothetical protein